MIEFIDEGVEQAARQIKEAVKSPDKRRADYFTAVRDRGMLNASLDVLSKQFDEAHKEEGLVSKWEYYNPNVQGGTDLVSHREVYGFRLVDASEIDFGGGLTPTAQKEGPVRRGDLVMMCAPREVINMIRLEDAKAANDDLKAPQEAFKKNVEDNKVKTSSGEVQGAVPFGTIKQSTEQLYKTSEAADPNST